MLGLDQCSKTTESKSHYSQFVFFFFKKKILRFNTVWLQCRFYVLETSRPNRLAIIRYIIIINIIIIIIYRTRVLQIWVCVDLIRYCGQVCTEICDHLHIELFRISPQPHAADRNGAALRRSTRSKKHNSPN